MTNQPPLQTFRDDLIKAVVWKNTSSEGKIFYSVDILRSYEKDGTWKEISNYSGAELWRVSNLATEAYNFSRHQKSVDRELAKRTQNTDPVSEES